MTGSTSPTGSTEVDISVVSVIFESKSEGNDQIVLTMHFDLKNGSLIGNTHADAETLFKRGIYSFRITNQFLNETFQYKIDSVELFETILKNDRGASNFYIPLKGGAEKFTEGLSNTNDTCIIEALLDNKALFKINYKINTIIYPPLL